MKRKIRILFSGIAVCVLVAGITPGEGAESKPSAVTSPYAQWQRGLPQDPGFFPIAVWLQSPGNAAQYKQAGINLYVGLWEGPNAAQISELKKVGMKVICDQNPYGIQHLDESLIVGWMHGDEPDNAQDITSGWDDLKNATVEFSVNGTRFGRYGPPVSPLEIISNYKKLVAVDPTRPVFLNLGQGVAWDGYNGRGTRAGHPEDYPKYVRGCDIASFDIYPVVHSSPEVAGNLWYVAEGVKRLKEWSLGKPVWNCIECTRIDSKTAKPTPDQVRAEVWMSLIHGSMGLIYFVHEWVPQFDEAALLHNAEMLSAVTKINQRITELAPLLNSPTIENRVTILVQPPMEAPVAAMMKEDSQAAYLFTVAMRKVAAEAVFTLTGETGEKSVEVLDEDRTLQIKDGRFQDSFKPYEVHLYRIKKGAETGVTGAIKNY